MKKPILLFVSFLVPSFLAVAQPAAVQQLENTQRVQEQQQLFKYQADQNAPELYSGENEDMGPQRILKLKARHKYFDGTVDSQFFYTSNARLAQNAEDSSIWVNTAEAAFTPPNYKILSYDVATRAGVRAQWYNYGLEDSNTPLNIFDFHAQTAFAEESFAPWQHWRFFFGMEATRLLTQPDYDEFYKELAPNWGVTRFFPMGDDKLFLISYKGYYRITDQPSTGLFLSPATDRTDHTLNFAYSQQLGGNFVVTPFYRFQYTAFTAGPDRNDYFNTVGVFLTYNINKYASARTFFDFEKKQTDNNILSSDYDKFDVGLGATLNIRF
ncbi:MAG: hypothetical protein JWM68_367 [Verrucomicrobiales bacterium]|nr:hypothetical protein [Verrucomicrobiales bacterium]